MNSINTIRRSMSARRAVCGEYAARDHLRWLLAWASNPELARELATSTSPDFPAGHWAREALLAAADAVESGIFRARPARDPRLAR